MPKSKYVFTRRNPKTKKIEDSGYMEIKNADEGVQLYIYGDIVSSELDAWSNDDIYPQGIADFMNQIDMDQDLTVYVNSGGGDVFAGIAIYNILSRHTGHIKGIVDGIAASIASVILMACDEIVMATGTQIMIHKPLTIAVGNADDLKKVVEELDNCQKNITDIYMKHVKEGVSESDITEKINAETWMNTEDAQEVFDITVEERPKVAACIGWMMDRYKHVPEGIETQSVSDAEKKEAEAAAENAKAEADMLAEMELMGI